MRPMTKMTAAITRKSIGALSNNIFITVGAGRESYLSSETIVNINIIRKKHPYIDDFLHVIPRRLLIAEETLKTNDMNQKKLTMLPNGVCESGRENWRVVAVTLEKNVAIVVILMYRVVALSFSSAKKVGRAEENGLAQALIYMCNRCVPLSPNDLSSSLAAFISVSRYTNNVSHM